MADAKQEVLTSWFLCMVETKFQLPFWGSGISTEPTQTQIIAKVENDKMAKAKPEARTSPGGWLSPY